MNRNRVAIGSMLVLFAAVLIANVTAADPKPADALEKADLFFEQKNYREAATQYKAFIKAAPKDEEVHRASKQLIASQLRLQLYGDALDAVEGYVKRTAGTYHEARARHLAGNLWMSVPHWGTRSGGDFHRAQWKQGIRVRSFKHDKKKSIAHLEKARQIYATFDALEGKDPRPEDTAEKWREWRIKCSFDLAGVCSRFGIYENQFYYWHGFWGERDDFLAGTVGEDDFDEYHSMWQQQRKRPIGLRIDKNGKPIFPFAPKNYSAKHTDDQKLLFLLGETRELDHTKNKRWTGLSYYRQAMLARTRFGMDRMNQYAGNYWVGGKYPLKEELEAVNPWELKESQSIVLAGGRITTVTLPKQFDVLALLRTVVGDYAKSGVADEAQYSIGLYYQSRQQYTTAIDEFATLTKKFEKTGQMLAPGTLRQYRRAVLQLARLKNEPNAKKQQVANVQEQVDNYKKMAKGAKRNWWVQQGEAQVKKIRQPQVRISQTGVQLPGDPAKLQLSYRNTSKVWFVARKVDHLGFMNDIRNHPTNKMSYQHQYTLRSWHQHFVNGYYKPRPSWQQQLAAKHIGREVARWSDEVKDDGTYRYAHTHLQTAIKERGAYMVFCYLNDPPESHAQLGGAQVMNVGNSRAIYALTDVAIVEKKVKQGNLYMIADAVNGAPIPGAKVDIMETWSTYDRKTRKSIYHKQFHNLKSDQNGFAVLPRVTKRSSQLHALVDGGQDRTAWTGMSYWSHYNPSRMRNGLFAYTITDRPVYRPNQSVKFKVWLRQMNNGVFENKASQHVTITIYDPRGNKVHTTSKVTDQYGGMDGEFALSDEPKLGVYRLQVHGQRYVGGANFRVEEYKKPEFEVSVEPGKSHAKLGEKVTAVINAKYYFGGAVTDANVKYKVFREEYRHSYYFPGRWDWLYGPGYGYAWYNYEFYPWWGRMRSCYVPPHWWYGYYGGSAKPIRELVQQGEARIGEDGTLEVEIDSSKALKQHGDLDHRYVVQAEVRDSSRRTITGEGAVKVTRQAYYNFVQPNGGYYRPGEEMVVNIRALTPDNKPVKTEGIVTISEIVFGGPENAHIKETELKRFKASTDERGELRLQFRWEKSGQLRFKFSSPDEWGNTVDGFGMVWVVGRDFDGRFCRFNDLELITDKREYKPGDVAHIMINTRNPNSYVLFSDDVDSNHLMSWKLLHLSKKSMVVDVPIKKGSAPNFFIEATTVANTRVHQQLKRIVVPPEKGVINVAVKTNKPSYKPGEKAEVVVTATDLEGLPAQAQVTISAFDKSVLYIQSEYTPQIAKFFHGNVRRHNLQMTTNLYEQFSAHGYIHRPFQNLYPYPQAWYGVWSPGVGDFRTANVDVLDHLAGGSKLEEQARDMLGDDDEGGAFGGGGGDGLGGELAASADAAEKSVARGGAKRKMSASGPMPPSAPGMQQAAALGNSNRANGKPGGGSGGEMAEAEIRTKFSDTAVWLTTLTTDSDGRAIASFTMPDNLTTWKINTWAMTKNTKVGQVSSEAITTKNLLVRLQAPRFFMEYDEVVISANVHNYLKTAKMSKVSLNVPKEHLELFSSTPQTVSVMVPANGEKRIDWRVKVLKEGVAKVLVKALTDEESDAMQMSFPVLVHGITKQVATTGSMRPHDTKKTTTVTLKVPEERRPELTYLEVQYSPSLVGSMLDALPYCLYYPYGCTEQTMSRFLPAVMTMKTLQNMGISLEETQKIRGRMAEIRRIEKGEKRSIYSHIDNPVFNTEEMNRIIKSGLDRISNMQNGDGGWGWWKNNKSSGYLTAYVLNSLLEAQRADLQVNEQMIQRGMNYLRNWEIQEMRKKHWGVHAQHAYVAYVLSMKKQKVTFKPAKGDDRPGDLIQRLWNGRDKLTLYGKALLSLALSHHGDKRAPTMLQNIMQYLNENKETQVAWFRIPEGGGWWYWWNNDIETNAWCLRALIKQQPKSDVAPKVVKWLLNNRKNGYYWRSTRDTTLCVAAMSDFVVASGEGTPDFTLTLDLDNGKVVKKVKINRENFFTYDNKFILEGVALGGGTHKLKITKEGPGALYFNTYLRYFTKEKNIKAAGHELKVDRKYFKLQQIPYIVEVEGADGQKLKEKRLRYKKVPVKNGDLVKIGDVVMVELKVTSDNNYTYLAFEDMKPAGFEPTQVKSGGKGQEGFYSYMELRDEKVVFFVGSIDQGEHLLRYRLRAEVPGVFHALPSKLYAMYVPELRANSNEHVIRIED